MTNLVKNSTANHAIALLSHYSFDLEGYAAEQFVQQWASSYPVRWVRAAVIESLYQGRYKAVSVGQILAFWQRRGEPLCHYNYEFERIICSSSPQTLTTQTIPEALETAARKIEKRQELKPALPAPVSSPVEANHPGVEPLPPGFGPESPQATPAPAVSTPAPLPPVAPTPASVAPEPPLAEAAPLPESSLELPPVSDLAAAVEPPLAAPPLQAEPDAQSREAPVEAPATTPSAPTLEDMALLNLQHGIADDPSDIYQANWSRSEAGKYPIHQFVPIPSASEFHEKLKAVSQQIQN